MRHVRSRSLRILALVAALMLVASATAQATHSWGSYHWARTTNPFTLQLGDNVSATWDTYLVTTSIDWSRSSVLDTTIVAGGTDGRKCRATAGRVEVCAAAYGKNGWLGLASIWASGSHITQGTAKMNDSYFNSAPYTQAAWRNLVMCQEVGHTLGLDHQDEGQTNPNLGTCMDYTNNPAGPPNNEHPNGHDYAQLETIYGHSDGSTTIAASPTSTGGRAPVWVGGSHEDGTPFGASPARGSWYAQDLGGGRVVFTHVFWVPDGARGRH